MTYFSNIKIKRWWSYVWTIIKTFHTLWKQYRWKVINIWAFWKYDSKFAVKHKTNPCFFLNFDLPLSPPKFRLFTKMPSFFFFENVYFTLSPSSSPSIHNIVIAINTPTTMNNQFEVLNAPKNRFTLFLY